MCCARGPRTVILNAMKTPPHRLVTLGTKLITSIVITLCLGATCRAVEPLLFDTNNQVKLVPISDTKNSVAIIHIKVRDQGYEIQGSYGVPLTEDEVKKFAKETHEIPMTKVNAKYEQPTAKFGFFDIKTKNGVTGWKEMSDLLVFGDKIALNWTLNKRVKGEARVLDDVRVDKWILLSDFIKQLEKSS